MVNEQSKLLTLADDRKSPGTKLIYSPTLGEKDVPIPEKANQAKNSFSNDLPEEKPRSSFDVSDLTHLRLIRPLENVRAALSVRGVKNSPATLDSEVVPIPRPADPRPAPRSELSREQLDLKCAVAEKNIKRAIEWLDKGNYLPLEAIPLDNQRIFILKEETRQKLAEVFRKDTSLTDVENSGRITLSSSSKPFDNRGQTVTSQEIRLIDFYEIGNSRSVTFAHERSYVPGEFFTPILSNETIVKSWMTILPTEILPQSLTVFPLLNLTRLTKFPASECIALFRS